MNHPYYYRPEIGKRLGQRLNCDLCIYGATAAGVIAAVEGRRQGLSVVLLAAGEHIGGLTTGGLGFTDFGDKRIVGGLARDFYRRLGACYGVEEEWTFEPSMALRVLNEMLREEQITPILSQYLESVEVVNQSIHSITLQSGLVVTAGQYIDATYEGDLMARAGVPYTVGREANSVYGELMNGVQIREHHQFLTPISPWRREGDSSSGLLPGISPEPVAARGTGDKKVQAYNFRMCLTRSAYRIPFAKPEGYNPEDYELLARYLRSGWREMFVKFDAIRGRKTDTNNHGAVSTDFIGANHDYPEADYSRREEIFQAHVRYHQGLFWFYCHDERVPADVARAMRRWGLASDEFQTTNHWPAQLYVREARRMVSDVVVTELDCRGLNQLGQVIGYGAYGMDAHNCQRVVVDGRVLNEGDVQIWPIAPYPIPYAAVVPPQTSVGNLFVPVCLSASHIAYGSVRMEPVFMLLGQSCATAAALCQRRKCRVQELPYRELSAELERAGQVIHLQSAVKRSEEPVWADVLEKTVEREDSMA